MRVADDKRIDADPAQDPIGDTADHAVLHRTHTERAHDHQVVIGLGDVVDKALPVLAVEGLVLEGQPRPVAGNLHHVAIRVRD